jgi:transcriptional regulator with XRE-family HTH domain
MVTSQPTTRKIATTQTLRLRKFQLMAAEHTARIGSRIKELREERGMAQRELADLLPGKTDSNQISKWERGVHRPGDDALDQIAAALGVDTSYFLVPAPAAGTADLLGALSPAANQLDRIEAKLDAVITHLGLSQPLGEEPAAAAMARVLEDAAQRAGKRSGSTGSKRRARGAEGR